VAGAQDIQKQQLVTRVKSMEMFNPEVAALHLLAPRSQRLRFLAGQAVQLSAHGMSGRYAIASCPCEDRHIEIQILRKPDDDFSKLLFSSLKAHDSVEVEGPYGEFVLEDASTRPVIFVAFGVGFAPIKSLIQHSMSLDQAEAMDLHWLADQAGHYQNNLCRSWADALDNFSYFPHLLGSGVEASVAGIVAAYPDLQRFDVYAAGTKEQLQIARRLFVARGLPEQQWRAGVMDG
jgi:CDP-4-dehydro-6-deoxyglucose reductase